MKPRFLPLFGYLLLTLLLGCRNTIPSPTTPDFTDLKAEITSKLQNPVGFDVYLYSSPTLAPNNYQVKTPNTQLYFEQDMLLVRSVKEQFNLLDYHLLRVEYAPKGVGDPTIIKRMEIYFDK